MAYLDVNLPPIKCFLRKEYLYDDIAHHGEFVECILVSAKSLPNSALLFQVILNNGTLRDKLPVSALVHDVNAPNIPFDFLQLWNCLSYSVHVTELSYLSKLRTTVKLKDGSELEGRYLFTFNWTGESVLEKDMGFAETPNEHKSGHFIQLDNGCFCIQPNNRIRFHEMSFINEPFPDKPDYKVCTKEYNCENGNRWVTPNEDKYFYGIKEIIIGK